MAGEAEIKHRPFALKRQRNTKAVRRGAARHGAAEAPTPTERRQPENRQAKRLLAKAL